jgi:hypothetical protein
MSLSLNQINGLLGQPLEAKTASERKLAKRLFNQIAADAGVDNIRDNGGLYLKTWQLIREVAL